MVPYRVPFLPLGSILISSLLSAGGTGGRMSSSSLLINDFLAFAGNIRDLLGLVLSWWSPDLGSSYYIGVLSYYPLETWSSFQYSCGGSYFYYWSGMIALGSDLGYCFGSWCLFLLTNPGKCFHSEIVGVFPRVGQNISKKLACWKCNCGDTMAASRLITRYNNLMCLGDGPI